MKNRVCCDCGKTFYGANNAKRCPACRDRRIYKERQPADVDELTLDVREADAAGLSYGQWRARQLLARQEARKKIEKARHRKAADAGKEEKP